MKLKSVNTILIIAVALLGLFISCKEPTPTVYLKHFRYTNADSIPQVSVHRGGKNLLGFPENCLETMAYINDSIKAIFEVDVAQTKDGKLVLMHDNSINRTTTGDGLIRRMTYNELSKYNLKDDYGTVTKYKVPLFSDVLKWSKAHQVVLTVDVKRSVSQQNVIKAIKTAKAEANCILITYDLDQAESAYKLAPELLLSVSARNTTEFERLLKSIVPVENMVAFTGTRLSSADHYKAIHDKNILCILGTLGNLDKQAKARGDQLYLKWKSLGVDIIATDRPFEVYKVLNQTH